MLSSWGMQPVLAAGAEEALRMLREAVQTPEPIGLVLTDLNMPQFDGFMLTESIRNDPSLADVTVIMLTSGGRDDDRQRCQELQIAARLLKPVKQSEVFDAIALALGSLLPGQLAANLSHEMNNAIRGLRVLLAEDNVVNQKLAVGVLQQQGHHVTVAKNGKDALQHWEAEPFDLILMDVQMPEMDGFEATRIIREKEHDTEKHIPIIAMTARAMKGDRERCLESGMDDYLAKPIHIEEVAKKIAELMGQVQRCPGSGGSERPGQRPH